MVKTRKLSHINVWCKPITKVDFKYKSVKLWTFPSLGSFVLNLWRRLWSHENHQNIKVWRVISKNYFSFTILDQNIWTKAKKKSTRRQDQKTLVIASAQFLTAFNKLYFWKRHWALDPLWYKFNRILLIFPKLLSSSWANSYKSFVIVVINFDKWTSVNLSQV